MVDGAAVISSMDDGCCLGAIETLPKVAVRASMLTSAASSCLFFVDDVLSSLATELLSVLDSFLTSEWATVCEEEEEPLGKLVVAWIPLPLAACGGDADPMVFYVRCWPSPHRSYMSLLYLQMHVSSKPMPVSSIAMTRVIPGNRERLHTSVDSTQNSIIINL